MTNLFIKIKRGLGTTLAGLMVMPCITGTLIIGAATDAEAGRGRSRTVARSGPAGGTTVRHTSTHRSVAPVAARPVARGTARRTTRRVARRRMYTLPAGYRAVTRGAYRYYYHSGIYYYPYYMSGQTVYIEIDVDASGNPGSPPPASDIEAGY